MNYSIYNGKTKSGKPFEAIKLKIGEYETLLFPTKIEMLYLKSYLEKKAHEDFKGDDLNIEEK